METRYKFKYEIPPRISYFTRVINGKECRIKLVRDSFICNMFSKKESLIFGKTIYARKAIVPKKVFNRALERIKEWDRLGGVVYIWRVLTTQPE